MRFFISYAYDRPYRDENNDGANYRDYERFWVVLVLIFLAEYARYLTVILEISELFLTLTSIIEF